MHMIYIWMIYLLARVPCSFTTLDYQPSALSFRFLPRTYSSSDSHQMASMSLKKSI